MAPHEYDTVTYSFTIDGLDHDSATRITMILEQQPGVHRAQASAALGRIAVDAHPAIADPEILRLVIIAAGHHASLDRD